jgi:hypothetical protein
MNCSPALLSATLLAASAAAQCLPPVGTGIGVGPDVVLPIQSIGFAFPFAGTTYTHIHVCDKVYAFLSNNGVPVPPTTGDFSATPGELVQGPPRLCPLWSDIQILSGNQAQVFLEATPTVCTVTWHRAQLYAGGQPGGELFNVQMRLFPSGEILFDYDGLATNGSNSSVATWQVGIVGVSPGGGVTLPSSSDLSSNAVVTTVDTVYEEFQLQGEFDMRGTTVQLLPLNPGWAVVVSPNMCAASLDYGTPCTGETLSVTANGAPTIGNASFALDIAGVPNLVPAAFLFFGDQQVLPGISLAGIGMPGCEGYTNASLGSVTVPIALPAGTGSQVFPIPNNPGLAGVALTTQAIALSTSTPLNLISSNGTLFRVGN